MDIEMSRAPTVLLPVRWMWLDEPKIAGAQ